MTILPRAATARGGRFLTPTPGVRLVPGMPAAVSDSDAASPEQTGDQQVSLKTDKMAT